MRVDNFVREINRTLRARNSKALQTLRERLDRAVAELRWAEAVARSRCESADRHAKKHVCGEHARLREQLRQLQIRDGYVPRR